LRGGKKKKNKQHSERKERGENWPRVPQEGNKIKFPIAKGI